MKLIHFIRITRPANIVTSLADIIGGLAIAQAFISFDTISDNIIPVSLLLLATVGLYGGGIVFNDVFDLKDDEVNRPERVIPSGKLSLKEAILWGIVLLTIGITASFWVSYVSGFIACTIAFFALLYDSIAKKNAFLGPFTMGLCRSFNLLLGLSFSVEYLQKYYYFAVIPLIFIAAVTLVGQKENTGHNKSSILKAIGLDTLVVICFLAFLWKIEQTLYLSLPFIILWYGVNSRAKWKAYLKNEPKNIMLAVKTGVLSIILLDAIYVAGFSSWIFALALLCLLPISIGLAKFFAVT